MVEFPEQKLDTAELVEDVLQSTYFKLMGDAPDGGSFRPTEDTVEQLDLLFDNKLDLIDFLKLSIALHIFLLQQKGAEQVPFFINRHLLSEKRVALLDKYAAFLRERYGSKIENVKSFSRTVHADVTQVEADYFYFAAAWHMRDEPRQLECIPPTLAWGLASATMNRFKGIPRRNGCPIVFAEQWVKYDGRKMHFEEAWALEVKACEKSKKREDLFMEKACEAFTEVRTDWAMKIGLVCSYKDGGDNVLYRNLSDVDMELLRIEDGDDLFQKDLALLTFAKKWLLDNGADFSRHGVEKHVITSEALVDEVEAVPYSDDFKLLGSPGKKLDKNLASILADD